MATPTQAPMTAVERETLRIMQAEADKLRSLLRDLEREISNRTLSFCGRPEAHRWEHTGLPSTQSEYRCIDCGARIYKQGVVA